MNKIMFNDKYGLTQAVLDGRKTQTRRVVMPEFLEGILGKSFSFTEEDKPELLRLAKYKIGEEVAVAQRYSECHRAVCLMNTKGWDNKMFTKALFLPHRIKITNIRIERLQDISDEDCMKEGVMHYDDVFGTGYMIADPYNNNYRRHCYTTPRKAFAGLIDKTCGKGTWDSNPYVFVYEFELIK